MRNFLPTKNVCFGVIFFAALIFIFVGAPKVFAAPPFSPYAPGETTNPSCGPTDPNCTVTPSLAATTTLTTGSVPFIGNVSGTVYENNANLFWNNTTDRFGIGTAAPATTLEVNGNIRDDNVLNAPCIGTDSLGDLIVGTCTGGGSSSSSFIVTAPITYNASTTAIGLNYANSNGPGGINLENIFGSLEASLATTSISQFVNDAGYVTSTNSGVSSFNTQTGAATYSVTCVSGCSATTSTTGTALTVTGGGTGALSTSSAVTAFNFPYWSNITGGLSGTSTLFFSSSTGNIGIGTTAPGTKLDVNGDITDENITSSPFLGTNGTGKLIGVTTATLKGYTDTFGYATSSNGIASYNVTSANPFISVSTTTTSAALAFSTSSFGSNAFNSTVFLSTSTGLTTANFATTSISQFANDAGYITTSTNNFGGLTNASITAISPIVWSSTSTISCPTCLSGSQTVTLTGAVTGSGTTSIATTFTTSTLYGLFSGGAPITFNTSTGAIGWTNSLGYITTSSISINGVQGNVFTGLATSTGIASYNVTSANSYISVSTTTTSAALTFSTSSFGSNAFNSTVFLSTSTGLTTANFATTSVSQFANDAGYISSLSGALLSTNNLSDLASATAARSNLGLGSAATHPTTDFLASSTAYVSTFNGASGAVTGIATNTGNWAGTWQGVNSSSFYLATNPSNYISTSTGLTTANFATTSISQWANDAHYITTSTDNFGGLTNASITAVAPILWSSTSTISCPTCLTSNQTVTLTGAVTGSGTTSIATTFTTSTLYGLFSGGAPITFNTSTGAIGWTNSLGYIATSTGLTTANFATTSISQWANDAGYITTSSISINGVQGNVFTGLATSTGIASYNVTSANPFISVSTTTTSAALTFSSSSLNLGSAATHPSTDFLASSTTYVASVLSTTTAGGINFSATTGSNITGILNSLAITQFTGVLPIANGGSNATSAAAALANFGGISTSTYNASITIATAAPLGGGGSLSNGTTLNLTCTGCLTSLSGAMLIANNGSDINNTSTFRANLGLGSIATHPTTDFLASSTAYVSTFNGTSSAINFHDIGTGNVTTSVATSGGNTTTTISLTGVIPAANGGTATTTALGSDAFSTSTIYGAGAYLGTSGSNLTVSSTLASSTWNFVIENATTTSNTTNIMEWTTPQSVNINSVACHDTVGTTSIFFFIPTSDISTSVSSTIEANFSCGVSGQTASLNLTYPAGQAFIVEVTSTAGTPVATPVHITYTKL